jgi:hypothetical protein
MAILRDEQPNFALPEKFQEFQAHWMRLRGARRVPKLADFLDHPLPDVQPWICILDAPKNGALNVRLLGTAIVAFYGIDITGGNFLQAMPEAMHARYLRIAHDISRLPCGIFHKTISASSQGRELELMATCLPYECADGTDCCVWLLEAAKTPQFNEMGTGVERIMFERWIDLGQGVPA